MRKEILTLQPRIRATSIYVTHDQVEAITMADWIVFFFNDPATTEIYTAQYTLSLHDALPIAAQISHSLNPFGVQRSRGIDESESAEHAWETAKWRNPVGRPSPSRPMTKTASPSSSRKRASRAITNPRSGSSPRHSAAISSSSARSDDSIS